MSKISFVVPAHNEEKLIALCLAHLIDLEPYIDYEVLIGLDNCTDFTLDIVKQMCKGHPQMKYTIFEERQGKTKMINQLIQKASGDIIIMCDSDWGFSWNSSTELMMMLNLFKDSNVSGIADSLPVSYPIRKEAGIIETGSTLYGLCWEDAVKQHAQDYTPSYKILDPNYFPGLVNIFRKKDFINNETLADDFERALNLYKQNKIVLMGSTLDPIRMKTLGEEYSLRGIWSQKKRTALARQQLNDLYPDLNMKIPKWDLIKSIWRNVIKPCKIKYIWSFGIVTILFILSDFFKPKALNTTEGWKLRGR